MENWEGVGLLQLGSCKAYFMNSSNRASWLGSHICGPESAIRLHKSTKQPGTHDKYFQEVPTNVKVTIKILGI